MKKRTEQILALALLAGLLLTLSACTSPEEDGAAGDTLEERTGRVYAPRYTTVSGLSSSAELISVYGDTLYLMTTHYDSGDKSSTHCLASMGPEGEDLEIFWSYVNIMEHGEDETYTWHWLQACAPGPEGGVTAVYSISTHSEVGEDGRRESEISYYLMAFDRDGAPLGETDLMDLIGGEGDLWLDSLDALSDGTLLLRADNVLYVIDPDWRLRDSWETDFRQNIFVTGGDQIIVGTPSEDGGYETRPVDLETGEPLGDENVLPDFVGEYSWWRRGTEYDLYLSDSVSAYGFDLGGDPVELFVWRDMDLVDAYNNFVISDDGVFYHLEGNQVEHENHIELVTLSRREPGDVGEKIQLTYGFFDTGGMRDQIVAFNRENPDYRINARVYSPVPEGIAELEADILAGDIPDILRLEELPYQSYAARGLLADIGALIDGDSELGLGDFSAHLFDLFRVDGTLYTVVPHVYIETVAGRTDLVGEAPGWTPARYLELTGALPEDVEIVDNWATREGFLDLFIRSGLDLFMDLEAGTCDFDNETFIGYLTFAAGLPEWVEDDCVTDMEEALYPLPEDWVDLYEEGRVMLSPCTIASFRDLGYLRHQFGQEVTFVGMPCEGENGSVLISHTVLGIAADTEHMDAAWQFLRFLLAGDGELDYGFSTRTDTLETQMEAALMSGWGEAVYWDEGDPTAATQEEVDRTLALIESVDRVAVTDPEAGEVIRQEAEGLFAGEVSAADAAAAIQGRVSAVLAERYSY